MLMNEKMENKALLESKNEIYLPLNNPNDRHLMEFLLNNADTEKIQLLNEATVSQDIAQYVTVLKPIIRYVYPRLIANHLLGIQPMATPTSYIYSIVSQWRAKTKDDRVPLVLYELDDAVDEGPDAIIDGETIVHVEHNMCLMTARGGRKPVGSTIGRYRIVNTYSNNTAFGRLLKNFSEANLKDEIRPEINNIGFSVLRKAVEAKVKALRGEYTLEMYQDLKSQHGLNADSEITTLIGSEIQTDIDTDVINFVNSNSTQLPDWDGGVFTGYRTIEKARELSFFIADEASNIARRTNRGIGNILLCSGRVANLLASLDEFAFGPVDGNLSKVGVTTGPVGVLNKTMNVIVDPYAQNNYATILYKGDDRRDAMGYFCPYTPLTFVKVTNSQTGTAGVIGKARYGLTTIPGLDNGDSNDRAALYASTFSVII